ncbi:glycosyltransferase [Ruania suaedae]|uniref:glycosyltransferase n=1 Tax=Ruania suaedae TaxID=2897774 RepID=UPI001E5D0DB9|nr:glycosyltransferase [Ruania suaedae]UFU01720.1 glycosyltransferase [Ruania suaedae]
MSPRIAMLSLHTSPGARPGSGDVGGMNVVIRELTAQLHASGCDVEILTRRADPDVPDVVELDGGVRLRSITAGPPRVLPKREHEALVTEFGRQLLAGPRYDLVHAHHWYSGLAAGPAVERWQVPLVQSFHSIAAPAHTELGEGERPESPGRLPAEADLAGRADALLAVSTAEARTIVERLGAAPDRVHVVPPGVDTMRFRPHTGPPPRAVERDRRGRDYLLVAARLEPLKGVDLAIETLAGLEPATAPDLVICGGATAGEEEYVQELHRLVAARGLQDRVRFLQPQERDDLAALMAGALLVLAPSHSETYGLTALEAAASGVPVVAAASGGLVEAVLDGETGTVLTSREPRVWAGAVASLLAEPAARARMGRAGRAHAERHTWARMAEGTLAVYERLLARSGAPGGA